MYPFQNNIKNDVYTFYYDESNNVRKLYLSKQIDGYNVDHDEDKNTGVNFMLGGIAHKGDNPNADFEALKKAIMLQPTAKEIKLKQIATGDFIFMLNSRKLTGFLNWLNESDLFIHYFNLNMEYWSYLDIIEDGIMFCLEKKFLHFYTDIQFREYQDLHKDELYKVVCHDKIKFIQLLKSFDYPYLKGKEQEFLKSIYNITAEYAEVILNSPVSTKDEKLQIDSLCEFLEICIENGMNDFTFTMDERFGKEKQDNDNYLVDGFSIFYQQRAMNFSESKHMFDVEEIVREEFDEQKEFDETLANLDITFIDSDDNYFVQVSDVVAGLFQRYFNYLNTNKTIDVKSVRASLNPTQLKNMDLFKSLINKSDAENKNFLFYVMSKIEHEKHIAFTFPEHA
ncbi:TPA: hypothetical protein R4Z82_005509 [Enterobacter hormaechei subsp. xiangfangensis]|nr:hypothetical protein [Salmonella enterica]EJI9698237.1 hypothetical protein [Salmonella enterica subsp. enterica serovar Infantis]EKE6622244.1 hypothetical protein [Salmonella enterica subsp. enterica serovar Braenderup]HED2944752.1 hypothetical protein [Enterobacter hormaechei subsp. xiangfangensis]EKR7594738.1 hypothetical protein [Salmonella enterica]